MDFRDILIAVDEFTEAAAERLGQQDAVLGELKDEIAGWTTDRG